MKAIALGYLFNDSKPSRSAFFYILLDITITRELKDDPPSPEILGLLWEGGPGIHLFKKHC